MRRAQSVRHRPRSSTFTGDDMGMLTEDPDASPEDALRRQLLELGRENDRLQTENQRLKHDLQRRGSEAHDKCNQEIKQLEMLFTGAQRDNEQKMAELERSKIREKMLERELAKLAGENWQIALDIPYSNDIDTTARPRSESPLKLGRSQGADTDATQLLQLEQMRMLILGMDEKLQEREQKLGKTIERAENEGKMYVTLQQEVAALDDEMRED